VAAYQLILGRRPESKATIYFSTVLNRIEMGVSLIRRGLRLWTDVRDTYVSFGCLMDDYERSETRHRALAEINTRVLSRA
jgi:hypothetical protein